eukprot:c16710_g1_i1 orf=150-1223(-)
MSNNRGSRALRRRPCASEKKLQNGNSSERKKRSLQSLQERLCFTLKGPRTSRARPHKGGPNSHQISGYGDLQAHSQKLAGKLDTLMENGLIQIPHFHCDYYYESPTLFSISSSFSQESLATTSSASSSITQVGLTCSPISSFENSSDDGFSSDEVMSLVRCSDMVTGNVLDFMPSTLQGPCSNSCPDMCGNEGIRGEAPSIKGWTEKEGSRGGGGGEGPYRGGGGGGEGPCSMVCPDKCEKENSRGQATLDQSKEEFSSSVEDDLEPYRIDLCDFVPDVNAINNCSNEQQQDGAHTQKNYYGGGVLCLRLDYEEVLRAWKERGECLIPKEPTNYPSPYLDPFHTFAHTSFVPHPPYF